MHPILFEIPRIEFRQLGPRPHPDQDVRPDDRHRFPASAFSLPSRQREKGGLDPDRILDLGVYLLLAAIVGSRVLYVLTDLHEFAGKPARCFCHLERRARVLRRPACGRSGRHLVCAETQAPGLEDRRHHGPVHRARPRLRQARLFFCRLLLRRALQRPVLHHLQRSPFPGAARACRSSRPSSWSRAASS